MAVTVTVFRSRNLKRILYIECTSDFALVLASVLLLPVGALLYLLEDSEAKLGVRAQTSLRSLRLSLANLDNYWHEYAYPGVPNKSHTYFSGPGGGTAPWPKPSSVLIVKRDLSIITSSSGAVMELLRSGEIEKLEDLESKVVNVSKETAMSLILAALNLSSDPLTEVFSPLLEERESNTD